MRRTVQETVDEGDAGFVRLPNHCLPHLASAVCVVACSMDDSSVPHCVLHAAGSMWNTV